MHKFFGLSVVVLFLMVSPVMAGDHSKCCDTPVQDCLNKMVHHLKTSGFIGVELEESEDGKTLIVSKAIEGSPAEKVGIKPGDELHALNGIRFSEETYEEMNKVKVPGNLVTVTIKRDGQSREMKLTLVPMPADLMAKHIGDHMIQHAKNEDEKSVCKKD